MPSGECNARWDLEMNSDYSDTYMYDIQLGAYPCLSFPEVATVRCVNEQ